LGVLFQAATLVPRAAPITTGILGVGRGDARVKLMNLPTNFPGEGRTFSESVLILSAHTLSFSKVKAQAGESMLAQIMTTREMAKYLRLHEITICKLCREGKIPSVRIGRVWRFDREVIDEWISRG